MTTTTLTRILDELAELGLIHEVGYGESTGGRRPILYELNPNYGYVIGMDISRTASRIVLCDMHCRKLSSRSWPMDSSMTPEQLVKQMLRAIQDMLILNNIALSSIIGMGIGAVGPLDRETGTILEPLSFPAPGWYHVDICSTFQQQLGVPVFLDNGANTALLGEYWLDYNNRAEHLLYIHAGVGIRSAMMAGGQLVYGAVDMEGSAGQMIIQTDGRNPHSSKGNYGSWESYASIFALELSARAMLKQGRSSLLEEWVSEPDEVTYSLLERALAQNDPLVVEVFSQAAVYFGIGLANLLNILHPERVILGGPLLAYNSFFFQQATQVAVRKTYHYPEYQVAFNLSTLAEDAVAVGAAVMALNRTLG